MAVVAGTSDSGVGPMLTLIKLWALISLLFGKSQDELSELPEPIRAVPSELILP